MKKMIPMTRYRNKPVDVDAWQVGSDEPMPEWARTGYKGAETYELFGGMYIKTPFGEAMVEKGDYIIMDVKGELHPCKPDVFEQTYEAVE